MPDSKFANGKIPRRQKTFISVCKAAFCLNLPLIFFIDTATKRNQETSTSESQVMLKIFMRGTLSFGKNWFFHQQKYNNTREYFVAQFQIFLEQVFVRKYTT